MTPLERIAAILGSSGVKALADELEQVGSFGRLTIYLYSGRPDRIEVARSTKVDHKAQLRVVNE
jgi:hypothetical protein